MGFLSECFCRGSSSTVAAEPSTPPHGHHTGKEHLGHDLGKQPLAERKQLLGDSPAIGPGLLAAPDAAVVSANGLGASAFGHSRSRARRTSLEAAEALNAHRERRLSGEGASTSAATQPAKGFASAFGWLKGGSKGVSKSGAIVPVGPARNRDGSVNTAELLQRRGFPVHYAKDIHKSVSTSQTKPIAVLGLEPSSETGGEASEVAMDPKLSTDGSPDSQSRRNHNKLFPLYVNGVAKSYFKIGASRDYAQVLRRLLRRDPLLTFALQKAIKNLSVGDCKPVSHVTSDPTGASASLYGLRITPCVWSDTNGHKLPALLLEHNVPYESQDVMPRLLRDYAVLSHVPSILTLIDFNGHVLYQNAASIDYCGDLTSHNVESGDGMLGVLFQYEPQMLQEMLQEVNEGNYWQQVVRVPASLKRHMVFETESSWGYGQPRGSKKLTAAVSKRFIQDALEPEFQLESFTTQNARSQRTNGRPSKPPALMPQPSIVRTESVARGPQRQDTRESGVAISGPAALPVGRLSSITGGAPRLGSHTLGSQPGGHVAFSLPNQLDEHGTQITHGGSFSTGVSKTSAPTQHSHLSNAGQNRRFMTLMQSAAQQQQQPSFTGSMNSFHTDGDKPDSRQGAPQEECWHDISAIPLLDPVLDKQVILLLQTNVTARVELENRLADLTDAQLGMLEQLFPRHVIEYMLSHKHGYNSRNLTHLANHHDDVIVLFTDVVGFTSMSKEVEPSEVMHFLNELYTIFDDLVDLHDLYKLDTVGDCYIVVAGLTMQDDDGFTCTVQGDNEQRLQHAQVMMDFAKAILRESKQVLMPHNHCPVQIRIGIHIGSLASGLVGPKMPKFTLFGDTMNTASRMESTCKPGCVQVSEPVARLLPLEEWQDTGGVEVKGKGLMQTFLWIPKPEDLIPLGVGPRPAISGADDEDLSVGGDTDVHAPAPSAISSALTTAPDDSAADRTEVDGTTRATAASPANRPKSGRAAYRPKSGRPKSSRPRSSRYVRPKSARVLDPTGGAGAPTSRPSTASSHGGAGGGGGLQRSLSRRNVSFRFHGGDDELGAEEDEGPGSTPFLAILNAIRGSGTGEDGDGTEVIPVGTVRDRRRSSSNMRMSVDGAGRTSGTRPGSNGAARMSNGSGTGALARVGNTSGPLSGGSGTLIIAKGPSAAGGMDVAKHVADLESALDKLKPEPPSKATSDVAATQTPPRPAARPTKAVRLSLAPELGGPAAPPSSPAGMQPRSGLFVDAPGSPSQARISGAGAGSPAGALVSRPSGLSNASPTGPALVSRPSGLGSGAATGSASGATAAAAAALRPSLTNSPRPSLGGTGPVGGRTTGAGSGGGAGPSGPAPRPSRRDIVGAG
ncbi:hypothetical protein HYH03_006216 [Edaphochlamys debaryana]|uniref:Guanylate cyclase domain-containing protein n=1 Tax=Edaphochlamys debaryana TaxID=47281 RepID=A0A835Y443_9CHLO|nr:hypothetical protein HYH03_006216 [Edaphochlamys debaryana]|eukprot:KAG2495616.1 hypothetical protein HYH03_006216 [Edaphochlamys debaryana]